MKLTLDDEQEELRKTLRRLLSERSPSSAVRTVMASDLGYDPILWKMLGNMGVLGLVVPEEFGGAGVGMVERAIVAEELGRALTPAPFFASAVLATDVLLATDDVLAREEFLPRIASGALIATAAIGEGPAGTWNRTGGSTHASKTDDGGWVLSGSKSLVVHGDIAELVLVYARTVDGPAWFAVDRTAAGLSVGVLTTLDPTRRLSNVDFLATPARRLESVDPEASFDRVYGLAVVALAGEQVGGLQLAMEMTVDYAKIRIQFGRAIGSFQAVKHGCADMYSTWEHAVSVLRYAAWAADEAPDELSLAAVLAQAYIGPAYFQVASKTIQYHGGIGFTWEHDAHLYFKRAKTTELLLGSPSQVQTKLADRLAI